MQVTGSEKRALIVLFALAAHLVLQMLSATTWVNLAPLLAAAFALAALTEEEPSPGHPALPGLVLAIGCFGASYLISWAISSDQPGSRDALLALLPGPLILALLLQMGQLRQRILNLCILLAGVALVGALYLCTLMLTSPEAAPGSIMAHHYSAAFVVPNDVLFLVCLSPFPLQLLRYPERPLLPAFALLSLLSIGAAVVLTESRSGLLLAAAVLATYAMTVTGRAVLLGGLVLAAALALVDWAREFGFLAKLLSTETLGNRLVLWWAGFEAFREAPWLGRGPGTFEEIYRDLLASGQVTADVTRELRSVGWAHSLYIEALAERGILGLITLLGMFGAGFRACFQGLNGLWWNSQNPAFPLLVSLTAVLLAGAVELTFMRTWVVSLSFLLLGLSATLTASDSPRNAR